MARIYPLFSSSGGNSSFIGTPQEGILIDAGLNCKRLVNALRQNDISPEAIKAIFITHDHSDHISALKVFTKQYNIPVYASPRTMKWLEDQNMISSQAHAVSVGSETVIGDFSVRSFKTPHDAVESVGYKITTPDGKSMCICTDLGCITEEVDQSLTGCELVLIEANYDERMLRTGPYPFQLKQRIASREGHLSNIASAKEVKSLILRGTTRIILGHLSRDNNTPQIAKNTLIRELGSEIKEGRDFLLHIAPVETEGMMVTF